MDIKTLRLSFRSALGGIAIVFSGIIGAIDWAARADFVADHFSWLQSMAMTAAPWFATTTIHKPSVPIWIGCS
jgi:hypothetical protein